MRSTELQGPCRSLPRCVACLASLNGRPYAHRPFSSPGCDSHQVPSSWVLPPIDGGSYEPKRTFIVRRGGVEGRCGMTTAPATTSDAISEVRDFIAKLRTWVD